MLLYHTSRISAVLFGTGAELPDSASTTKGTDTTIPTDQLKQIQLLAVTDYNIDAAERYLNLLSAFSNYTDAILYERPATCLPASVTQPRFLFDAWLQANIVAGAAFSPAFHNWWATERSTPRFNQWLDRSDKVPLAVVGRWIAAQLESRDVTAPASVEWRLAMADDAVLLWDFVTAFSTLYDADSPAVRNARLLLRVWCRDFTQRPTSEALLEASLQQPVRPAYIVLASAFERLDLCWSQDRALTLCEFLYAFGLEGSATEAKIAADALLPTINKAANSASPTLQDAYRIGFEVEMLHHCFPKLAFTTRLDRLNVQFVDAVRTSVDGKTTTSGRRLFDRSAQTYLADMARVLAKVQ